MPCHSGTGAADTADRPSLRSGIDASPFVVSFSLERWRGALAPCRRVPFVTFGEARMALLDFVKSAGEKLFHLGAAKAPTEAAAADPGNADKAKAANDAAADAIVAYIKTQNLVV